MNIIIKEWYWNLTIFAGCNNNTTIGQTIYVESDWSSLEQWQKDQLIAHESIHIKQQAQVGIIKFMLLYFLCLPLFWNQWRWKWEYQAYKEGSRWEDTTIIETLRSWHYGWLKNG